MSLYTLPSAPLKLRWSIMVKSDTKAGRSPDSHNGHLSPPSGFDQGGGEFVQGVLALIPDFGANRPHPVFLSGSLGPCQLFLQPVIVLGGQPVAIAGGGGGLQQFGKSRAVARMPRQTHKTSITMRMCG